MNYIGIINWNNYSKVFWFLPTDKIIFLFNPYRNLDILGIMP